ncbi:MULTISPECIES: hypothetical protein [unclassified Mesorhizobium]|uniref:hypothetical protein n=1 Tax=unclassified Mesorhizobium TaxID=325217 RepID=UPI001126F682|nr:MULTISPECIES: hypothetical protein [unclassified Mesorhizobium]TPJ38200.1 hypothetical protein FJ437_30975 [Mesorhizobium sp. B2-6-6]MCA0000974.1 hypothetical protein [Mesorhizobium sp. B264B2A]MCA0004723.1 hypothetical protein [Mesorhizobium sp. B264B1B]MCA0019078.1 hypothetical protein [Mesorhizobium sp. B264B1A]TPJ52550.1 hypothetical protein FJ462_33335 [Mesorhizobium sp. B2-6-7]
MVKGLTLALLIALAGCATTKGSFCALESPTRLSAAAIVALSDAEARGILAHNLTGQKLCGWKP